MRDEERQQSQGSHLLTLVVAHKAGLGGDHPLSSGLAEDSDVGLGLLTQHC